MARTKGSYEKPLTDQLKLVASLRVRAERAGTVMKVRVAATLVIQADKKELDLLRALAKGPFALTDEELDKHNRAAERLAARIRDASPSKRNQTRADTAWRHENDRLIGASLAKRSNPNKAVHLRIDDPRKTIRTKVDALVRNYERRGDELEAAARLELGSGPEASEETLLRELVRTLTDAFKEVEEATEESLAEEFAADCAGLGNVDPAIDGDDGAYVPQ